MTRNRIIPVQIIGTQRSGSNLLRLMLNQLEEMAAPHPPHILKTFIPFLPSYGSLDDDNNFKELIADVCNFVEANPVKWSNMIFDREELFDRIEVRSIYHLFSAIYEMYAEAQDAKYWCCKSMANIDYAEEFEMNGFNPFYIHLYRDGRDVALSFKKVMVGHKHTYHLAKKWQEDQEKGLGLFNKLGSKRVIQVSYEELILNPETQMRRLCEFLNIDFNPIVFDFYNSKDSVQTAESGEMWRNVRKPLLKNNFNKYSTEMTYEDILMFESVARSTLTKLNYPINFAINGSALKFSRNQIKIYSKENDFLINQARKAASTKDVMQRFAQEKIVEGIHSKFTQHLKIA